MSVPQTRAHPDPQPHPAHDPYAQERAYPAPPLRGPSEGLWRTAVVWAVTLAFLAVPMIAVVLRGFNGLAGWMMIFYVMFGMPLQILGGLAVGLSLLMLPRVNTVHERRSGIRLGAVLLTLLVTCWAAGVLGPGILPDLGDAPDSAAALPLAVQLWGQHVAEDVTSAVGLALCAVSVLSGLAVFVVCLVRRLRDSAGRNGEPVERGGPR